MTKRGRPDQILGARVVLTARDRTSEPELDRVLEEIAGPESPASTQLPIVVLEKASREKAEWARDLLVHAGGTVSVEDVWVTREEVGSFRSRPECPSCGSGHTQPYLHAGPAAKVNMKCTNCGQLFRAQTAPS